MSITAIILTKNEEMHIARAINSIKSLVQNIVVVDSGSVDSTVSIAKSLGARVLFREWINHATQFNWALTQLDVDTTWVLRLDADEYLTQTLVTEIKKRLGDLSPEIEGVLFDRRMTFRQSFIRHGGVFPVQVLRLFRNGCGRCENRWMDEHIIVAGECVRFSGELIDDNLNTLSWWIEKHNGYASREAIELLNLEFRFTQTDSLAFLPARSQASRKRWLKENVYAVLPGGIRALVYFIYRYLFRLGFLDGYDGFSFHFLQGFWYRYIVDAKIREVKQYMQSEGVDVVRAIDKVLSVEINKNGGGF